MENTHTLRPGVILEERYRIERVIGEGGFGITYEAVNQKINMTVAIKEFYCRDYTYRNVDESCEIQVTAVREEHFEHAKRRFLQEAKILSGLNDENAIVKILDYFEANGTAYIVMNYLYGTPLDKYLKKIGVMPWREVLEKFRPLIETLERVHNRGVLHRDISPGNIMVLENGSLCLLDFGSAKERFIEEGENTTAIFSKQGYTPIEQYAQNGKLGAWTDIYALAAVLYECLTGICPPDSVQRAVYDEYETLRERKVEAPPEMDILLKKGLAVRAEQRYSNMEELLNAVNALLVEKKSRKVKRICLTAVLVVLLCTFTGVWFVHTYKEQIYFNFEETEAFRLVRDDKTTIADFDRDFERIEERIKILAGSEPYIWEKKTDEFYGVLPLSCFGEENPKKVIRDLLARPCKWTICDVSLDSEYIDHIDFKDGDKREMEISLSEETPENIREDLRELCKDRATLSVDYGFTDHLSLDGQMNTPLNFTWDLQEQWKDIKMRELFVHNISGDMLSVSLEVYTQIQATWETESSGTVFGKRQCASEDLDDDTVTLEYWCSYSDERTEGEIADFLRGIKERLDLLDIPYAAGRERNDSRHIILCVNQQDYNRDLFWLLFRAQYDIRIEDGWGKEIVSHLSVPVIELGKNETENSCLIMNLSKEDVTDMEDVVKSIENMEQKEIESYYLVVNGIRVLKGSRSDDSSRTEQMKRGQFTFSSMCMENEEPGGENEVIVTLLNSIIECQYNMVAGRELYAYQFSDSENIVAKEAKKENKKYHFSAKEEERIVENIKALSKQYDVKSYTDYEEGEKRLRVMLSNQIYSESLLDKEIAVRQIYDIMKECNLENDSPWNHITIAIGSRYNDGSYAARLILTRGWFDEDIEKPYSISVVAYEKEEGKWMKDIYDIMSSDSRFKGYGMDFTDYSDYFIY